MGLSLQELWFMGNMAQSGWWYTYPTERYEFVNWDAYSQLNGKKCFKPPTRYGQEWLIVVNHDIQWWLIVANHGDEPLVMTNSLLLKMAVYSGFTMIYPLKMVI